MNADGGPALVRCDGKPVLGVHSPPGGGRFVPAPATTVGELPAVPVRSQLVDHYLVVQREVTPGVTEVSALDLTTGQWRTAPDQLSVRQLAAGGRFVVVPADERCMVVHELGSMARLGRYCADPGRFVSLLTSEDGGPQWRVTPPGRSRRPGVRVAGPRLPSSAKPLSICATAALKISGRCCSS